MVLQRLVAFSTCPHKLWVLTKRNYLTEFVNHYMIGGAVMVNAPVLGICPWLGGQDM